MKKRASFIFITLLLLGTAVCAEGVPAEGDVSAEIPWWVWALLLFGLTFVIGILAVIGGFGGGILFVPIVSALFPFHLDFVRGAGIMVAMTGALAANPRLIRTDLANLRMALPFALIGSVGSIAGAVIGFALPEETVKFLLGVVIMGIMIIMLVSKRSNFPVVDKQDGISKLLKITGAYRESSLGKDIPWQIHRMPIGIVVFLFIGFMAGMFGIGAGWANVPALNLLLGVPLKVAVGTSSTILAVNDTAAAWIYLNNGAVLPLVTVPSIAGMMIGTRIGARLLTNARPQFVKWVVICALFAAGVRQLLSGLGIWG